MSANPHDEHELDRLFYSRMAREPLLGPKKEVAIARRIERRDRLIRRLVLSSPLTIRELLSWESLISEGEMTPKELMRRGSRTRGELVAMRRRLKETAAYLGPALRRFEGLRLKVEAARPSSPERLRGEAALLKLRQSMYERVACLDLNEGKLRRLTNKIKGLAQRVREERPIGSLPVSRDELVELDRKIRFLEDRTSGDKNILVESNLRLVISIAQKHRHPAFELFDLVQEGCLGLRKAADKFDTSKGFRFSTYATWWIRQSIHRAIADHGRTVRVPVHIRELLAKVSKVTRRYRQETGAEPSIGEYARHLRVSAKKVKNAITLLQEPVSLSAPVADEAEQDITEHLADHETPAPTEVVSKTLRDEEIEKVLSKLDEREAEVIRLHFGLNSAKSQTLQEIGRRFNITRERVRQIEVCAMRKLRSPEISRSLRDYHFGA